MILFTPGAWTIEAHIESDEGDLLAGLIGQVRALLVERSSEVGSSAVAEPDSTADDAALLASLERALTPVPPPEDEVIARLFPAGRQDQTSTANSDASEFRRLTEEDLRTAKIEDANAAIGFFSASETDITLDMDLADRVLRALNDVRLSMGTRLGVSEQTEFPEDIKSEEEHALMVYFWVGQIQEQLLRAMMEFEARLSG